MIINPNNIEKWCFDYFEGNLTSLERVEFERFILEHPEYHAEFEAWKETFNSEDERTPTFIGVEGLLVGIPFYATWAFKVSVGAVLAFTLGTLGYYQMYNPEIEKQYVSQSNSVEMSWSPKDHLLALVKYNDYAYGDYEVATNTTTSYTTTYIGTDLQNLNSSEENTLNDSQDENNASTLVNEQGLFPFEKASYSQDQNTSNESNDLLAFHDAKDVAEEVLCNSDEDEERYMYKVDHQTLFDHMGISSRYQFLNFNNSKVKGIGSKNKKKGDNHPTITQSKKSGKASGGQKKKSHFFTNLKHLELGLSNINDPISVVPNYNTIGMNPALAGQLGVTRLKLNVRNQWWNTDASIFKGSFYFDTYFEKIQAGLAYGTEYDLAEDGEQKISKHSFTYAQKFNLSKNSNISVGVTYEMSKGQNLGNPMEMKEFYMNSPISANSIDNQWKSDLGIATWYSGKYFFGGINVTNWLGNTFIATHEENTSYFNKLNYSIQLGTDYKRSMFAKTVVSPYIQYNKIGDHEDLWLGSVIRIKGLVMGGSVATSKSAKAMLGLQGNKLRFTVSSDYSKSMLLDNYSFSHEVSLRILVGNKNNNWSRYDY